MIIEAIKLLIQTDTCDPGIHQRSQERQRSVPQTFKVDVTIRPNHHPTGGVDRGAFERSAQQDDPVYDRQRNVTSLDFGGCQ